MYGIIRPILFALSQGDNERAHLITKRVSMIVEHQPALMRFIEWYFCPDRKPELVTIAGITFPNRIGLAAGFDKDAELMLIMQALGFGFVEIGSVVPEYQYGNEHPRMFRIPEQGAMLNRMGFNSKGATVVAGHLRRTREHIRIPVGGSLGKQKETPLDDAAGDYTRVLLTIGDYVDYYAVNVSSPNTPGLRKLQGRAYLESLLKQAVLAEALRAEDADESPKPMFAKLAPDLTDEEMDVSLEAIERSGASGVILGNTSLKRPGGITEAEVKRRKLESGGWSGKFQYPRTLEMTKFARSKGFTLPLIACGGITSPERVIELQDAGADLFQIFTGLVYQGPALVPKLVEAIR